MTKLEWTQRLGDAFLADEAAVMRTVQSLRLRAQQAGNLQSTPQQNVIVQERAIVIEPAQPEYVYVPVYNPEIIYGPWWAPAYRPWYWYPGPIWGYPSAPPDWGYVAGIFWGTAWAINAYNWGWCRPNWGGYNLYVNVHGNNPWVNRPYYRDRYANAPNWSHAPEHRRGVAYRDPGTATTVPSHQSRRDPDARELPRPRRRDRFGLRWRLRPTRRGNGARPGQDAGKGFTRPAPGAAGGAAPPGAGATTRPAPSLQRPGAAGSTIRPTPSPDRPRGIEIDDAAGAHRRAQGMTRPAPTTSQFAPRSAPAASYPQPAYRPESRPQVQRDAARGAQSRAAMSQPAPQPMRSGVGGAGRPSAPSAPSGAQRGGQRGGQGGGQGGGQLRQR